MMSHTGLPVFNAAGLKKVDQRTLIFEGLHFHSRSFFRPGGKVRGRFNSQHKFFS